MLWIRRLERWKGNPKKVGYFEPFPPIKGITANNLSSMPIPFFWDEKRLVESNKALTEYLRKINNIHPSKHSVLVDGKTKWYVYVQGGRPVGYKKLYLGLI